MDKVASQAAQDAVNRGKGAAGAGQCVPHISIVEARGLCSREPRRAGGLWGQAYRIGKTRTELTFISYKMPGALSCALHILYYFIYSFTKAHNAQFLSPFTSRDTEALKC